MEDLWCGSGAPSCTPPRQNLKHQSMNLSSSRSAAATLSALCPNNHHAGLAQRYQAVRDQSTALVAPLSAEDCQLQSMPDASPAKWHLAHTTWFFETMVLEQFEPGFQPFDPGFRRLFNSYYNGVGEQFPRHLRGQISRPALQQVLDYRQSVDERIQQCLQGRPEDAELLHWITLGLEHEQQHQELLLTDIQHALSHNPARPAYANAGRWPRWQRKRTPG